MPHEDKTWGIITSFVDVFPVYGFGLAAFLLAVMQLFRVVASSVSFASLKRQESSFTPLRLLFSSNPLHWALS